jgi:hypothetical protein
LIQHELELRSVRPEPVEGYGSHSCFDKLNTNGLILFLPVHQTKTSHNQGAHYTFSSTAAVSAIPARPN